MNSKQQGFTLVEVLVTVVLMAVGLLGMASLQLTALRSNHEAYSRSQATQLAYDIADRMRANGAATAAYLSDTTAPEAATCTTGDNPCTACTTIALTCTAAELANNDLFQWNQALTTALVSGSGRITRSGAGTVISPFIYTIAVQWDADRNGAVNADDPVFQMSFQL
ncbi:MAG: type IV pilus modification protein PilV [Methylobacter sp.]|nr:MAG: type IV pilus modification protein PilV [Methylobacter sp.]PPD02763.1 MAG: type IV pilus modification protein PilV [Methylobacter sp.]PPD34159.1 MAG: type IV pilus modification protein PilV [Methylomonas sp.]